MHHSTPSVKKEVLTPYLCKVHATYPGFPSCLNIKHLTGSRRVWLCSMRQRDSKENGETIYTHNTTYSFTATVDGDPFPTEEIQLRNENSQSHTDGDIDGDVCSIRSNSHPPQEAGVSNGNSTVYTGAGLAYEATLIASRTMQRLINRVMTLVEVSSRCLPRLSHPGGALEKVSSF